MASTSQSLSLPPLMPTPVRQTRVAASQKASNTAPRSDATSVTVSHVQSRRPSRMRHRRRARFAQQGVDDHHRPARFKAEIHAMEALAPQGFGHLLLELALAVEEEEATERVDLAAEQVVAQRDGERLDHMERVNHASAVPLAAAFLLAQNLRGI